MRRTVLPRGRRWRRRWSELDEDVREQIVLHVDAGLPLSRPDRAAFAVVVARRRRRDALGAIVAAPALTILAIAVGAAFGRATRGGEPLEAFLDFIGWWGGIVWIVSGGLVSALLLFLTRRWRARLRRAESANRAVVAATEPHAVTGSRVGPASRRTRSRKSRTL